MTEKEKILMSAWIDTVDAVDRFWNRCNQILKTHSDEVSDRVSLILRREAEALGEEVHSHSFVAAKEYAYAGGDLEELLANLEDTLEKQKICKEQKKRRLGSAD